MNTTFIVTGGAGRVVCSIPAFEKYHKLNPDDDFKIIVHGWESIFWSHPILQDRVFNGSQKGLFDSIVKNNRTVMPEPYHMHDFYNEKISLIEAWDAAINNTTDHSDLRKEGFIYLSRYEKLAARAFIQEQKQKYNKKYSIMSQPFGSGAIFIGEIVHDDTNRSIERENYYDVINQLSSDSIIFYASQEQLKHPTDKVTISIEQLNPLVPFLRTFIGLISECDYFFGCDSSGQHIARALGKSGTIMMGATGDKCFSYPEHFKIHRNGTPRYFPWRLAEPDAMFAARTNDGMMEFSKDSLNKIAQEIKDHLNQKNQVVNPEATNTNEAFQY